MNKIIFLTMSLGVMLTACTHREPVVVVEPESVSYVGEGKPQVTNEVKMNFNETHPTGEKTVVHQ